MAQCHGAAGVRNASLRDWSRPLSERVLVQAVVEVRRRSVLKEGALKTFTG